MITVKMIKLHFSSSNCASLLVPTTILVLSLLLSLLLVPASSFVARTRGQLLPSCHPTPTECSELPPARSHFRWFLSSPLKSTNLQEPDEAESNFGRMAFWDESYRQGEEESWYCGWTDELGPFFEELVPDKESMVLVPGIGNDLAIRDMFDVGGYHKIMAFDYAPQGVECAKAMFGEKRLTTIANTIETGLATSPSITNEVFKVCDARDLSGDYTDNGFDAVLDKGTFDSIYLSGGKDKAKARENLQMAVSEMKRVLKEDGIVFSVTAACVDAVQAAFDQDTDWEQLRDGSMHMTEEGYASNNVDATMLAWKLKPAKNQ